MIATITLDFDRLDDAEHILESINPDNTPLPDGISIESIMNNRTIAIRIECTRGIDSFRSTIEDIMSAIDLSIRTIDTVE